MARIEFYLEEVGGETSEVSDTIHTHLFDVESDIIPQGGSIFYLTDDYKYIEYIRESSDRDGSRLATFKKFEVASVCFSYRVMPYGRDNKPKPEDIGPSWHLYPNSPFGPWGVGQYKAEVILRKVED